jgi:hypothetical protein
MRNVEFGTDLALVLGLMEATGNIDRMGRLKSPSYSAADSRFVSLGVGPLLGLMTRPLKPESKASYG